jgi:hypothetical protein
MKKVMVMIWCTEKKMNFLFMNFSPAPFNFLHLRPKYISSFPEEYGNLESAGFN